MSGSWGRSIHRPIRDVRPQMSSVVKFVGPLSLSASVILVLEDSLQVLQFLDSLQPFIRDVAEVHRVRQFFPVGKLFRPVENSASDVKRARFEQRPTPSDPHP